MKQVIIMDKPAIKKFAIWARNKLIADTKYRAGLVGVTETAVAEPLPQSNENVQFFDVGLPQPYRIEDDAVTQRQRFVAELNKETAKQGSYTAAYQTVVDKVAYTWFNRLIAVRYMEVNDLLPSRTRVLSSADGRAEPQIVTSPFDAVLDYSPAEQQQIVTLKNDNKLDEAFRLLFLKQCAALGDCLPRLFEQVDDYMPLLLALSFTDKDGVVCHLVNDIPESDWQDAVQIVGWLYQYYNTEPKEQVFANLKKNIKISKENIPAATQLFTPDWIVRYMVENSLGRLWSEGHPDFDKSEWKYYLDEAPQEPQVAQQLAKLRKGYVALTPEDIKCIDPCMGSGHILAYLFDVLMQIYRSAGYGDRDAAASIVEHNLYGLDIDDRAAQMAYFVVMMKGCHYDSRFLRRHLNPHVYAIQESRELPQTAFGYCGPEEPTARTLWDTFKNAKEYGSILQPKVTLEELDKLEARLQEADSMAGYGSLGVQGLTYQLLDVMYPLIDQARMLVQKYDVVVTNPQYMGSSGMSARLSDYVKKVYPDSKSDLFAVFIEHGNEMVKRAGFNCMVTMQSWMFLSSFEKMRVNALQTKTITNLMHMENMVMGIAFGTAVTVFQNVAVHGYKGTYNQIKLQDIENDVPKQFPIQGNRFAQVSTDNFSKIPGSPVAYWATNRLMKDFEDGVSLSSYAEPKQGMATMDNNKYLRRWYEVEIGKCCFHAQSLGDAKESGKRWFPYNKGGDYRKWYGNFCYLVNWEKDGEQLKADATELYGSYSKRIYNTQFFFKPSITWSKISSGSFSVRCISDGCLFDVAGCSIFVKENLYYYFAALLNSKIVGAILRMISPTLNYEVGHIKALPIIMEENKEKVVSSLAQGCIELSQLDWDAFETAWDFQRHPLLPNGGITTLYGMKVGKKAHIESLKSGEACFSPVGDFIAKDEEEGNTEQGDRYEGIFARLKKDDIRIQAMRQELGVDLEEIPDGQYILLRRNSCKKVPAFCAYGMKKSDIVCGDEIRNINGKHYITVTICPSDKMYDDFLNENSEGIEKTYGATFNVENYDESIQKSLQDKSIRCIESDIIYDRDFDTEFCDDLTNDYSELLHKSKKYSYQREHRWILPDKHQVEKLLLKYQPLDDSAMQVDMCNKGDSYRFDVEFHFKKSVKIRDRYEIWQRECNDRFAKLKANEEELNRIFIDIYGLQDELTPEVEDKDVTVRRADLGRDIRSLISYAVGCIFGRYSLDKPGLAYAGGDWNPDQYHTFLPDADNVIPITDEEYFPDDLTGLFVAWVKKVFGAESLEDNLAFIAKALGTKGTSPRAVIRNYFLNGFYADHVKIYQKRPIYWLYDSGKQNGFKALIYMHRYNADTSGLVRADYLYKMEQVYESEIARMDDAIAHGASREVAQATKRKEKLVKQLKECKDYDDRLGHIALARIPIDLDDGVKVNYEKVQTGADGKKQAILAKI